MNFIFSRSIDGYMHDPARNDGITILHIDPKDADALESVLVKYGFEIHRAQIDSTYIANKQVGLWDEVEDNVIVQSKPEKEKRPKRMWVHKGTELKKILPEELSEYTNQGWKVGRT